MKFLSAELMTMMRSRVTRRNALLISRFFLAFALLVFIFTLGFHYLMEREGQHFSWITGFYWTLTVMSTLGFGDITFHTDMGRVFSIVVLLSGTMFMLVLLPFTFIEFFYLPWVRAQAASRAPKTLDPQVKGHAIITHYGDVTKVLIDRLNSHGIPYVILVPRLEEALGMHDLGLNVMLGDLDDPKTYENMRVKEASLLVASSTDAENTNVVFTAREMAPDLPVVSTASDVASVDILKLAGATKVVQLSENMGRAMARRVSGGDAMAHVIGRFDRLLIAEASAANTPLEGKTLAESGLREMVSLSVVGVWDRGGFAVPKPDTVITDHTVLVLAGSREQIQSYNELFCIYNASSDPIVIIGGGRVGRAIGKVLTQRKVDFRIVEKLPERVQDKERTIVGNAAELGVLKEAGIERAPAVMITTHDDDMNIYLTIYCRKLRPDIQIISRATNNVASLHRAGSDFVMSYASMGANLLFNFLERGNIMMVAEGLDLFRIPAPSSLCGKSIADSKIRERSGCTIVAVKTGDELQINPEPGFLLREGYEIIVIGLVENGEKFMKMFS